MIARLAGIAASPVIYRNYLRVARMNMTRTLLLATLPVTALLPMHAYAQDAAPAAAAAETAKADDIIVIGTRRTDRSVTDSASPIDVIGAEELKAQPASNMLDVVKNLVPSFFVAQNTISDASTFVRSPSLRGLPGDQILVMINGKRFNRSSLVQVYSGGDTALSYGAQAADIGTIPSIAIKSLQILREGATAQYGSDAIGGVINYGIRDNAGLELQARYGQTYRGDGKNKQIAGNFGVKLGDTGFVNLSAEWFDDGQTSRGATRPIALQFAQNNPNLATSLPNYPGPVQIWGSSPANGYKFFLNSAVDLGSQSKLYFTGLLSHSEANQSFNYRSPVSATAPFVVDLGTGTPGTRSPGRNGSFAPIYLTPCPAGNATCPAGGFVLDTNTFSFASVYPAGFTPRFIGKVDESFGTVGIKGTAEAGFTYDLSASLGRHSTDLSMTNSLSASYGPLSQTSFKFGKLIQSEINGNLDITYPLEVGFASPITLSTGAEYRREQYKSTTGDVQSYGAGPYAAQRLFTQTTPGVFVASGSAAQNPGASGYGGTSPQTAGTFSQSSYGIYAGAETDVTKALSLGLAGRYENYNTFGGAVVGKFNFLYRVSDAFSLRGTVGTGFHAPSPGQSNVQILTTNFVSGNQVQTGTYPVSSAIAQFYGAKALKPERSTNFGLGFILKPINAFTLTVDAYSIKVKNRLTITQNFSVAAADIIAQPALATVGVGGVINYFTNGFDTVTEGVDIVGSYRTELLGGKLNATLAYNYNKSKVTRSDPAALSAPQIAGVSTFAPKHRANFSLGWQAGAFAVNVGEKYYSSWQQPVDYPGQIFGAKFTTDFDISYSVDDHFTFTAGANNLFNTYPDRIKASTTNPVYQITGSLADGQIYPRSGGPFGINGGFWYLRVGVKY
jgi:iron complex outermembrane recepter protein